MPGGNQDNLRRWLEQSDIDFFTHFIKAWIPFNSWYRHSYDTLRTEREILDAVKSDGNRVRSRFIAKLTGGDPESIEIRNHLAALHRRLAEDPLEDRQGYRLSFENVCTGRNPRNFNATTSYGWSYRVERVNGTRNVISTVKNRTGATISTITQIAGWDIEAFETLPDFLALDQNKRGALRQCYSGAGPLLFASLLAPNPPPRDAIQMDSYSFINDPPAIFAGLVENLYAMRNLLFHGELVPDTQTNRTYEPAYNLTRAITRCII